MKSTKKLQGAELCYERGFHDFQEFIDPKSGGFIRCKDCGHEVDCEEDESW